MTSTDQHLASPLTRGRSPGKTLHNPVRISRIGSDHLQVFIRPVHGCGELLALVDRLEQLIDAGYDAIDVVIEPTHHASSAVHQEHVAGRSAAPRRQQDRR